MRTAARARAPASTDAARHHRDDRRRSSRWSGSYDYIVVGAGSAGCIVASRLSEDPTVRVLLVEAGGSDRTPIIAMPAALPFVYQNRRIQWGYQSGPEPELSGRPIDEKSGKVLGGTSSINAMIFNRGNPLDYEGWAAEGLPEWDYAHCLPYFKRMETFAGGRGRVARRQRADAGQPLPGRTQAVRRLPPQRRAGRASP